MRKVLIGLGLAIALLIVVILVLPFMIDLNGYKDQYQPMIEEALNRKITLQDLSLTIIPRLGVQIEEFTVMDDPAFSSAAFASLDSLVIGIKFMPLLSGRIEVEKITLKEPAITVLRNQSGVLNVSTLGKPPPAAGEATKETPPAEGGPLRALALLAVDRVSVEHGMLTYRDQSVSKPTQYAVQDLNLLLESVRLGDMATIHVDALVQPYQMPIQMDGAFGPLVETLDLKTIDLALALGKVTAAITGSAVGGHASLTVTSPIINVADLPVALPFVKPVEIRALHVEAEADYPAKPNTAPLDLATVKVLRFAVVLGNSVINVNGHVLEGEARLMAIAPSVSTADLPIILPLRKPVDVREVKLSAGLKDHHANVDSLSLNIFGGQLLSTAGVTLQSMSQPFQGRVELKGVQLGPVVDALMDQVTVSGTAKAQMTLHGQGFTKPELVSDLQGNGTFAVKDGRIEGVNLLQEAVTLLKASGIAVEPTNATVFSTIQGSFGIMHGDIDVQRFLMDSHDFQATGAGTIGFDQRLNLRANLSLSEALSRQIASHTPALRVVMTGTRMTVPLLITGTARAPVYGLDTKAFARNVQAQVKEQVKGVVEDVLKGRKLDLEKGKEALKNLFGR